MFEETYKDKISRKGKIEYKGKTYTIEFSHFPNYVRRSKFTGLPVAVGMTVAETSVDGKKYSASTECWTMEPFSFERGEQVSTGRLMKEIGLPTNLTDELKVE